MTEPTKTPAAPQQSEMPFAIVAGENMMQMPQDLYIPPDALEIITQPSISATPAITGGTPIFCG